MSWLARLFSYISDICYYLYVLCRTIAWKVKEIPLVGDALYNFFMDMRELFWDLRERFNDAADEVDIWWDYITGIASDLGDLAYDVYYWLVDKINDAVALANTAWDKAREALRTAYDAFDYALEKALWALAEAKEWIAQTYTDISTWVTAHAVDIYNAIKGFIQDAGEWIISHAQDVYNAIASWVQDAIAAALAPIAPAINLINLWFDAIQTFFNDPLGTILAWGEGIAKKDENPILRIFDKIMDTLWKE